MDIFIRNGDDENNSQTKCYWDPSIRTLRYDTTGEQRDCDQIPLSHLSQYQAVNNDAVFIQELSKLMHEKETDTNLQLLLFTMQFKTTLKS